MSFDAVFCTKDPSIQQRIHLQTEYDWNPAGIALLLTDSENVYRYVLFIGTFGGFAALFIPNSLGYTYYNMRYYHYILIHMMIVIVPFYYYKAYGYQAQLQSVYKTFLFILIVSPLIIYVNITFDRNDMFVGEKPRVLASILPDWPYYIFVLFFLMFLAFHLLYYVSNHLTIRKIRKILHV